MLSVGGDEGFGVGIQIAKAFEVTNKLDDEWKPKRSIVFCIYFGPLDFCHEQFLNRVKIKIVAYIVVQANVMNGNENPYYICPFKFI